MIIKQYIKDFEALGLGMFVHFGLYSVLGKGEWAKHTLKIPDAEYNSLVNQFDPKPDWALNLAKTAKSAGCKYITLTARHHDGFSLYDTCGLNDFDAPHSKCGRDLVKEFTDACRQYGLIPFFYHTLLDWYEKSFYTDFSRYLEYLQKSVEILCKNYGKIGGLWFDGMWSKKDCDWQEDALYAVIRKHQPEAMIINNTGLGHLGELGHIELDSVTFERGKPKPINMEGAPKYVASEMCEIFGDHWGYAEQDFNYKSPAKIIEELADCRKCGSNMLINVGPMGDGSIRLIDTAMLDLLGRWVALFDEAVTKPRPTDIKIKGKEDDFVLKDGKNYYLFCYRLPVMADPNVSRISAENYIYQFDFDGKVLSVNWMDDGSPVLYKQSGNTVSIQTVPYDYGKNLVVRVAKIVCK